MRSVSENSGRRSSRQRYRKSSGCDRPPRKHCCRSWGRNESGSRTRYRRSGRSDPEQDYFADGMVEETITALSRIPWLFVIARNSTFTYKGKAVDVKRVSRELGVRYVLEGSVRKG